MISPWLNIPLADYEGHMSSPGIGQAQMLADRFEVLIERVRPNSVAVVGCAGGNGLDRLEPHQVERVVAVDINPRYIKEAAARYAGRLHGLQLMCTDVQSEMLWFEPVDLIYAGLLFEYVDVAAALATMRRNCRHGGTLATVLQLPSTDLAIVSASPYKSLNLLGPVIRLVDPEDFGTIAAATGFLLSTSEIIELPSGKWFCVQTFRQGSL